MTTSQELVAGPPNDHESAVYALRTALESSEERFRVLAESAPIGIVESLRGEITFANPRAAEICGVSVETLISGAWTDVLHPDDVAGVVAFFDRARLTGAVAEVTFRIQRPDGAVRHVRVCAAPMDKGPDSSRVTTISDITEEVEAQDRLAHQAFYDTLTDLPNRDLFLDRLAQELAPRRGDNPKIAVLCLDLDRFKVVNDSLGHDAGDEVLKKTAARLRRALRVGETVARFGGDQFVLIIRDVHEVADAVNVAKRLMGLVQSPLRCGGHSLTVTGSIGVVVPGCKAVAATVARDAETAMYRAKEAGRDRYEFFNDDFHHRSVTRLALESDLRLALKRRQFEVYYQAGLSLPDGMPFGAEALIRWHHPKRGMVPPLEFIPVAEDSGMINAIGAWVFEQAVAQLASWDAEVNGPRLNVLAVNLSARQMDEPDTSDVIRNVLSRYGVDPARVCFELTESAVMTQSASTREALKTFQELGVRVAIDDFGTGYSSLAYLHTLPVSTLKIDRCFIERLGTPDDDSAPVVQAVIDMGHAMGLRVIAEGVSSEHLAAQVSAMGCDVGQGFYWCRPLPAEEFSAWWREAERGAVAWPGA
ncbi:MAG TPA: EAL domain-containing protein, partial [Acidimicrobiales bacterium]|nr:EAL domain-containing protein [Acidimicrobiales bacterium]